MDTPLVPKHAYVDLDGTLIDTERIKKAMLRVACDQTLTLDEARGVYGKARDNNGKNTMSLDRFVEELKAHIGGVKTEAQLKNDINGHLNAEGESILLPGAKELLEGLRERGYAIHILTLGVSEWQEQKMKWAGLDGLVDADAVRMTEVENTAEGKVVLVRETGGEGATGEGSLFINDKPDETAAVLREFPKLQGLVRREARDSRYTEEDFKVAHQELGDRFLYADTLTELNTMYFGEVTERYDGTRK